MITHDVAYCGVTVLLHYQSGVGLVYLQSGHDDESCMED